MQQRLMQEQALLQHALLQQQFATAPSLFPPAPHVGPVPGGNLPPGFDTSSCRSVYVGNIHLSVTEALLTEVFRSTGTVQGCKLIKKEKSSYGFVDYFDRRSAALAILTLNGRHLCGQPIKVNWAYASSQREDTSGHYHIFVGDLSSEITDAALFSCFSVYPSCSDARVMWDQKTGRSRGFGFVAFRNEQEAQSAINGLSGKWLGSRQIRCNWATKGAGSNEDKQNLGSNSVVELTSGISDVSLETAKEDTPESNSSFTTVYVGNLAPQVSQVELHRQFHALGAGVIEEVRVQREKGFGFVRYSTHGEAALAIQIGNGRVVCGKPMKCSWGIKPTPPGLSSTRLPPHAPFPMLSAAEVYERQLALAKLGAGQAMVGMPGQHAAMPLGGGASQAIYDGGFENVSAAQQFVYD